MSHLFADNDMISSTNEAFEATVTGFVSSTSSLPVPKELPMTSTVASQSLKSAAAGYSRAATQTEPIWLARHVDWPVYTPIAMSSAVPYSTISSALYQKLWRASRKAGEVLGINGNSSSSFSSTFMGSAANASIHNSSNMANLVSNEADDHAQTSGGYYTALGGLMGRVFIGTGIGGQHHSSAGHTSLEEDEHFNNPNLTRLLRAPRSNCVAAANGWIIAALDCVTINTTSSSSNMALSSNNLAAVNPAFSYNNKTHSTASTFAFNTSPTSAPPLRLLSKWNVRRGTSNNSSSSGAGDNLIPLPPPVTKHLPTQDVEVMTRIVHVFVDPTGSHTILSARNGEAYYIHSNSRKVRKLAGFGPNPDGSTSCINMGKPAVDFDSTVSVGGTTTAEKKGYQYGLTPGSYITSVAFDKVKGTEGSTKKILLGSSLGEIYEYSLTSPTVATHTTITNILVGSTSTANSSGDTGTGDDLPLLLLKLESSSGGQGDSGAVTGLHFERLGYFTSSSDVDLQQQSYDGLIVLAATSGTKQQTRLHTFTSKASISPGQSFREAFVSTVDSNRSTFVELPGSIDHAHLMICEHSFAMRTEMGIYYGTIDMMDGLGGKTNVSIIMSGRGGGSNGIIDVGMIPYDILEGDSSNNIIPISIAITNHHFITLSKNDDVRFINRMSNTVIQEEKVDWMTMTQAVLGGPTGADDAVIGSHHGELLVDVRRANQIWLRKSRSLIHLSSTCEDRDLWKFALKKIIARAPLDHNIDEKILDDQFDHAKSLCANHPQQKAVVTAARANLYLFQGKAEIAAKYMAQSPPTLMPFATTALRLALPTFNFEVGWERESMKAIESLKRSNAPLMTYLSEKMRWVKANNDDAVITSILGSWLVELFLHERRRVIDSAKGSSTRSNNSINVTHAMLQQFLLANVMNMDSKTIMDSLAYHDLSSIDYSAYAIACGDIQTAVHAILSNDNSATGALDALRVLSKFALEQAEPYYYKYALALLNRSPMDSAKSFLARYNEGLSPAKLLPAFMQYERNRVSYRATVSRSDNSKSRDPIIDIGLFRSSKDPFSFFVDDDSASMKFFEGVVTLGCKSRAIFDYLISLYTKMDDEMPLFRFLSIHIPQVTSLSSSKSTSGLGSAIFTQTQIHSSPLDMSYALRTILRSGRHYRSAVKLYMGFGMRQQAVELAIKVDPILARELAKECVGAEERKRIWLMIARQAAENVGNQGGKEVVAKVLSVIRECGPEVLSIEDVLPFLPDVAQIDQFKDEICHALTSYSSKVDHYLKEMNECDQACESLREEITRLQQNGAQMRADARCAFTKKLVVHENEPFYVFPSGYVVLESVLKREVVPFLNDKQRQRIEQIEQGLRDLRSPLNSINLLEKASWGDEEKIVNESRATRGEELQIELDGLLAGDCPLTGYMMIKSIDKGFGAIAEDDFYLQTSLSQ